MMIDSRLGVRWYLRDLHLHLERPEKLHKSLCYHIGMRRNTSKPLNLRRYFKGEIDTCDSIDISAALPVHKAIPPAAVAGQKRPEPEGKEAAATEEGARDAKKPRTDAPSAEVHGAWGILGLLSAFC